MTTYCNGPSDPASVLYELDNIFFAEEPDKFSPWRKLHRDEAVSYTHLTLPTTAEV